jgi:hypothetical protein
MPWLAIGGRVATAAVAAVAAVRIRDDVASLREKIDGLDAAIKQTMQAWPRQRGSSPLTSAGPVPSSATASRAADLGRRIDAIARQVEATLDGISDHAELQAGLRALVRMIRTYSP